MLFLLLILLSPSPPQARLAVLELHDSLGTKAHKLRYLSDLIRGRALKLPGYQIITRENLLTLLPAGKSLAECEGECELETGRRLGASHIITGELLRLGGLRLLLRLHETQGGRLLSSERLQAQQLRGLEARLEAAADRLLAPLLKAPPQPSQLETDLLQRAQGSTTPGAIQRPKLSDLNLKDLESLERFEEALIWDQDPQLSAQEKIQRWAGLAKKGGWLGSLAKKRQREWQAFLEVQAQTEEKSKAQAASKKADWARLSRLLKLKLLSQEEKQRWAQEFVQRHGRDGPEYRSLLPWLLEGQLRWIRIPPSAQGSAFLMAQREVSVKEYRLCVEMGPCSPPGSYPGCNWSQAGREEHPINCVGYTQAQRYARWIGARLPNEREWRRTAGSPWPWGTETPSCQRGVLKGSASLCAQGHTAPSCSRPAGDSLQGICDLIGNLSEWLEGPSGGLRLGGNYLDAPNSKRLKRARLGAPLNSSGVGFRLARSLE